MTATGDRVNYKDDGVTPHPAIVVLVSPDQRRAVVISGTSTRWRDKMEHCVEIEASPNGVGRFTNKTYFYLDSVHSCDVSELVHMNPKARCPSGKWPDIKRLAIAGALATFSREEIEKWPALKLPPVEATKPVLEDPRHRTR